MARLRERLYGLSSGFLGHGLCQVQAEGDRQAPRLSEAPILAGQNVLLIQFRRIVLTSERPLRVKLGNSLGLNEGPLIPAMQKKGLGRLRARCGPSPLKTGCLRA